MQLLTIGIAVIQGLALVGILALLEAIVAAFAPGFELPFSVWWGMIGTVPGLAISVLFGKMKQ